MKAPNKFHYEFTNIKWIKQNSTPLPLSGVHTPQQNFTLQEGKLTQCRQGQYLTKHYDELLGDTYSPDIIVTQTTDLNRTKMSAQLTLAGLWHSAGPQQWNPELWQRFPLHSETLKRDSGSTSRLAV